MNRPHVVLVGLLAALGTGATFLGRSPPPRPEWRYPAPPAPEPVTPAGIQRDLKVVVTRYGVATDVLRAGEKPALGMALVNTSVTASYPVVLPGDGSEAGWREPYYHWSATIDRGDGQQVPVPRPDYSRCGLYDPAWWKGVVLLRPGGRVPLGDVVPLDLQRAGRVLVRGHYSYSGGRLKRGRFTPDTAALGPMAGVPAFEIVSDPVELTVVRPLDVRVRVKRPLKVGAESRLSDVLDVLLVNQSDVSVVCPSPEVSTSWFRIEIAGHTAGRPELRQGPGRGTERTVPPGGSVSLVGPGEFTRGLDGVWTGWAAGTARVRVVSASVASEWVDVRVDP